MTDPVSSAASTATSAAKAPVKGVKSLGGKFKNLPPWAYVGAIGVGGIAVWYGINRSRANAAATAQDTTGTSTDGYSLGTSGDMYPGSGTPASGGYYSDPTTGTQAPGMSVTDLLDLMDRLGKLPTGGGTQPSATADDHYTPPSITVNIPPQAVPVAPSQPAAPATPPKPADPCVGEYPYQNDKNKKCYKVVVAHGNRWHYYKDGSKVQVG